MPVAGAAHAALAVASSTPEASFLFYAYYPHIILDIKLQLRMIPDARAEWQALLS